MQALERRFADRPPAPRRARRREFEYSSALSMFTRDESWRVATIGEGRKTSSALWKKSLPTTPKAKCTSSGIISISTTTDPWLAGAISIVATAIASSSTHSKTRLMGQPGGVDAFYKGNACETPASAQSGASGRSARVHRERFRWTFTAIRYGVRASFLKMSYENPALLDEQTYRPTSPAAV